MNIVFATYQSVMMLKGGPRTQILQTKAGLDRLGVQVSLFDQWKELRANDVDLVHIFGANMATFYLARTLHLSGIPFVLSPIFYTRRSARIVRSVVRLTGMLARRTPGIWSDYQIIAAMCGWAKAVLPNTYDESELFRLGFGVEPQRLTIIPNGVEARFAKASPKLFTRKFGRKNFILNVGHIGPGRKNVLRLIEALEEIDRPAVIIGRFEHSPAGRACLERAAKNPKLLMLDSLAHDSPLLASAYAACDVFALPSQYETPGIAALEAGLAGAKLVITPFGGTKEYFTDHVVYVDPYDVESIRAGLRKALAAKKDNVLRERIKREFLWPIVARKTRAIYERVLKT